MLDSTLLCVILFIGISIFIGLAAYVFFGRDDRPIRRPLAAFLALEALQFGASVLIAAPGPPGAFPGPVWTLRLRIGLGLFSLPLFIHMAVYQVDNGLRERLLWAARGAYALATAAAAMSLGSASIVINAAKDPTGNLLVVPSLGSLAIGLGAMWAALAWAGALALHRYGRRSSASPGARADIRRVATAWMLLLAADLIGAFALLTEGGSSQISQIFGILQYSASIAAVIVLASGILRYGSPAGTPLRQAVGTAALAAAAMVGLDLLPVFHLPSVTRTTMLLIASATGLITGGALGVIHAKTTVMEWSDDLLAIRRGSFTRRLGACWEELALGVLSQTSIEGLRQALKNEIGASFVSQMTATTSQDGMVTFEDSTGYHHLTLRQIDSVRWPIVPPSQHLMGPPHLLTEPGVIMRGSLDKPLGTLIVVGQRRLGGVYGAEEMEKMRRFAHILAVAAKAERRLTTQPRQPRPSSTPLKPSINPTIKHQTRIRILGGLEVEGRSNGQFPLRARQLLGHLILAYPQPVPREELMVRMWPNRDPHSAANNLHVAVHALRHTLEPDLDHGAESHIILREGESYRLVNEEDLWLDWWSFQETYQWAQSHGPWTQPRDIGRLLRSLGLYRGKLLSDASLDLPAEAEALRYRAERMFLELSSLALEAAKQRGDWHTAERIILHAVKVEPEAEDWHAHLKEIQSHFHSAGKRALASHAARER